MLTPELNKLMRSKFDPDKAEVALSAYQKDPDNERLLDDALRSLLPLLGRVVYSNKQVRSPDSDLFNEVISECLFKLLEHLRGEKFRTSYTVIRNAIGLYWYNVLHLSMLGCLSREHRQAFRESDPRVVSMVTPLASALPAAIYNKVLLSEIPEEVIRRAMGFCRFSGSEREACSVILRALCQGGQPPTYLLKRSKLVAPSKIAFLQDYCAVLIRRCLLDMRAEGTLFDEVTDNYTTSIWSLLVEEQDQDTEQDRDAWS